MCIRDSILVESVIRISYASNDFVFQIYSPVIWVYQTGLIERHCIDCKIPPRQIDVYKRQHWGCASYQHYSGIRDQDAIRPAHCRCR